MRVAVTGASGLVGGALVPHLRRNGHHVLRLVRRAAAAADEAQWDPAAGTLDRARIDGVDAVIHLAGAGVGDKRWTKAYKATLRDSRVRATEGLSTALAALEHPPLVLISGSAIGYYGDAGDRVLDESASAGTGFLADLVADWEAAADPARAAGIRVVHPRSGLVVSGRGGAWGRLWPLFRAGLGGRMGSGQQWWSFVSLRDEVAALTFLLEHLEGPVNVTAPNPVRNADMARAMGHVLRRPALLPVPAKALELVLGEFSSEILTSKRVVPSRLLEEHFTFADPTIEAALTWARGQR